MTGMPDDAAPTVPRRRVDVPGIISVIVGVVAVLPSLLIFLIGLVPDMQAIFWLLIVTIPILGFGSLIALILGVIGIVVGVRRHSRLVWSIVGVVLGLVPLIGVAVLYFGP